MTNMIRQTRTLLALPLVAVAVVAALLALQARNAQAGSTPTPSSAFSVLAQPPTAADKANLAVAKVATQAQDIDLDVDGARQLGTAAKNYVWLIPAGDQLCIGLEPFDKSDVQFRMSCNAETDALTNGVGAQVDDQLIVGVVPDGAAELTATPENGQAILAPVARNVYTLPAGVYTASYKTSDGTHTFGINK
jgi:hypothetical protein